MSARAADTRTAGLRRLRRWLIAVLAVVLAGAAGALVLLPASAVVQDPSATTKKGDAAFPGLEVSVSKTKGLVNEVVNVTWKGGAPSEPIGGFRRNFLQLMQCWGDDPSGPSPKQCQFGAIAAVQGNSAIGTAVRSRLLKSDTLPVDPEEKSDAAFLPFKPVTGAEVGGTFSDFNIHFDPQSTNEIPVATTHSDGKGEELFEVETATEAPGLGCGLKATAAAKPRACWLVVVPRSSLEVDGSVRTDDVPGDETAKRVESSPLSASNWKHRIAFPLEFQAIGGACPLGSGQITVLGHENVTEAIGSWQQSLCASTGAVFDFNQVADGVARGKLGGQDPSLSIVGKPLGEAAARGSPVYAPIAVSGLGFAYDIEVQSTPRDPQDVQGRDGARISGLKLTPRLVAKLLTQSYRNGSATPVAAMAKNPARVESDPEFQALNPDFKKINTGGSSNAVFTIITALNPVDVNELVWTWIGGDAEARDFLSGKPDPSGMVVNPEYKNLDLVRSDFPKLDESCRPGPGATPPPPPLCGLDLFPYANDMHESVRAAFRGDTLAKTEFDAGAIPPVYKKPPQTQPKGKRAIMVVSDTATAARLDLPMALLRNAAGKFVEPSTKNLLAGVAAMKASSTPGVLTPDPNAKGADVYPLTSVSYVATIPAATEVGATPAAAAKLRKVYAGFLAYAAGPGQKPGTQPGSLPLGYAPMPKALVDRALAAQKAITTYAPASTKPKPTPKPTPKPKPKPTPKASGGSSSGGSTGGGSTGGGSATGGSSSGGASGSGDTSTTGTGSSSPEPGGASGTDAPPPAAADGSGTGSPPTGSDGSSIPPNGAITDDQNVSALTPAVQVGKSRLALLWVFVIGAVVAAAGQLLPRARAWSAGKPPEVMPAPTHPAPPSL